eukprot:CAMPEP_0180677482 /NCGR_PEP_ID=MMETSP1037_2-20121125/67874_1 /TAXON_ID=632150 /ORGANISM="Azadinium spinosum, Strain 3D9" /LENGTH=50 /DNA_ID=CAMNT_0022707065 /DNA_START=26 /DNA_END=175 /DNA_ORIENTATION=-
MSRQRFGVMGSPTWSSGGQVFATTALSMVKIFLAAVEGRARSRSMRRAIK